MQSVDVVVGSPIVDTPRVKQVCGMFDVPVQDKTSHHWKFEIDYDAHPWNVGLIVGPSGCGKTQIARHLFGAAKVDENKEWSAPSLIDDFAKDVSVRDVTAILGAVGFNTIPSWLKPFRVLSNGEQFRATIARKILEDTDPIVCDEFTSVVDRQVARVASHAVQKAVRARSRKFVAVTCHADVEDWLQPDWVFEPTTGSLRWRSLRRRPELPITICRVTRKAWSIFSPYHYMSADMHPGAQCFGLFVDGMIVAFAGVISRPISSGENKGKSIKGVTRLVTLPDWQGLGLAFVLLETIGSAYRARNKRLRMYPAHPALVLSFERSPCWERVKIPGRFSSLSSHKRSGRGVHVYGGRPCGVYEYRGAASEKTAIILR